MALGFTACGGEGEWVRSTAERFYSAVDRGDGQAACAELSEDTFAPLEQSEGSPCEQAAVELELAAGSRVNEDAQQTTPRVRGRGLAMRFTFALSMVLVAVGMSPSWSWDCSGSETVRLPRENGLTLLFLATVVAQAAVGLAGYKNDQLAHHGEPIGLGSYLTNSSFAAALMENWQSEFLALAASTIFAVYLRERGSTQSKPVGRPHEETAVQEE